MVTVIEDGDNIEIQTRIPVLVRLFFAALAFFPLLAPYDLLIQPDWDGYFNLFFVGAAIISMGAMAISAGLMLAAVAGDNTRIRFDRAGGMVTYAWGAPVVPWRTTAYALVEFTGFEIDVQDWSEGEPTYMLVAVMAGGQRLNVAQAHRREPVAELAARVNGFLGRG